MTSNVVKLKNSLTKEQRQEISDKLEKLMAHYGGKYLRSNSAYFTGVVDGLNNAYKVINCINDDYNLKD